MIKRQKIGKRYVTRDSKGRFLKSVSIAKSLAADRRKKAKKKVKSGYGAYGDIVKKKQKRGHKRPALIRVRKRK
jgi:hypothetical protein